MIKLFTDTSANLPVSIIREYGIEVVPFSYTVNGKEVPYSAETDFNGKAFYEAMRAGAEVKTSMINVSDFMAAFEQWIAKGDAVIYVGMSGGISGTAHSAKLAAEELLEKYPAAKIAAIDTYAASLGEGFLVIETAKMIERGDPFLKIVKKIELLRKNMCQFFTVDDLAYLRKGGRISGAAAVVGTVLNIKPILRGDENGKIVLCGKIRGFNKSMEALANKYDELVFDKTADVGIAHADNPEGAQRLEDILRAKGFSGELLKVVYEPVTGSHVGPGTIAMFFMGEHK
ncbi:MAG: DegV family protein [Oscillospiraceae bacterium]|nr:DegV family protein [Oscillospiraceae bacterium]